MEKYWEMGEKLTPDDLRDLIRSVITARIGCDPGANQDATLGELGMDSLVAAEVVLDVEARVGTSIDANQLARTLRAETRVGDLISGLEAAMWSVLEYGGRTSQG